MSTYVFTLANQEDALKILNFYHSLIGTTGCTWDLDYPNEEIVRQDILEKSLYLLKEDNEIISAAFAGVSDELQELKWVSKNLCDLARFGVSFSRQSQGIGLLMLNKIIATIKERGFDGIRMIVRKDNWPALTLYDKNGFIRCGETSMYNLDFYCYEMVFDTPALEEMSDFFNNRAQLYEEKHLEHISGMESKQIIASFLPPHTKTMIDLGIGTGLELEEIFKRFPEIEVTGLDIAEDMLALLKEKYPDKKIHLYCKSYLHHDLGNCLYDVALSVMTLHHYNHKTKTDLYRKIHNSLNHNGIYIECDYMLSEHEYENPQEKEDLYFSEFECLKKEQGITDYREYHYDTPCTVSNQKKMLLQAGFSSVKEVWYKKNTVILMADK